MVFLAHLAVGNMDFSKLKSLDPWAAPQVLLALMVTTDLAFIALFGLLGFGIISDEGFTLTYDRSYAEVFQYVKNFWIVLLLLALAATRRSFLFAALAGFFTFMLADDYAMFHETWGEELAEWLNLKPMLMLQPYDFGELIVFAAYGVVALAMFGIGYRFAAKADRRTTWHLALLFVLLAFFAVGVDLLHALALPEIISNSIGALEDGGEMIVVSLMVWLLLRAVVASNSLNQGDLSAT